MGWVEEGRGNVVPRNTTERSVVCYRVVLYSTGVSAIKTSSLLPTKKNKKYFYKNFGKFRKYGKQVFVTFSPWTQFLWTRIWTPPASHASTTVQPKGREGGGRGGRTSITAEGEEKEIATPCCFTSLAKEMQLEGGRCHGEV